MFGPHNAVDGLRRSVSNGASWVGLLCWLGLTLIAFCESLLDDLREDNQQECIMCG